MSATTQHQEVRIREMEVVDIPLVYQLGNLLFHGPQFTTLYRTWDAFEVTGSFNQDPELCLVAESPDGQVAGFALGTTYEKEKGSWKYGHVVWLGVAHSFQQQHVGSALYREMEERMRRQGVRMMIIDTAASNAQALRFFNNMGFGKPRRQIWLSKVLKKTRKKEA